MRVYLIRHAECEDNVIEADSKRRMARAEFNKFLLSSPDSPLTLEGVRQTERLVHYFAERPFARLYSSPLPRALATAEALAIAYNLPPQIIPSLRELLPLPTSERGRSASLRWLMFQGYLRMLLAPESQDRLLLAYQRAQSVWAEITQPPTEAIAVVSHGWFLSLLLTYLSADPDWRVIKRDLNNTGVSLVISR